MASVDVSHVRLEWSEKRKRAEELPSSKRPRLEYVPPQSIEQCLHVINSIHETYRNHTFEYALQGSLEQSAVKKQLHVMLTEKPFLALSDEKKLEIIEQIILSCGHFPVSNESKQEDEEYLLKMKEMCQALSLDRAHVCVRYIDTLHLPTLAYNRASYFSEEAASTIQILKESERIDWQQIFGLVDETIRCFTELKEWYQRLQDHEAEKTCSGVLARAYEELADHHFDYAKELLGLEKQQVLSRAINYYNFAKTHGHEDETEIDLSIINTKYELAYCKSGMEGASVMQAILEHLQQFSATFYKTRAEVMQYRLDALYYLYQLMPSQELQEAAAEALREYVPFCAGERRGVRAAHREALEYLRFYVNAFEVNTLRHHFASQMGFQMTPASLPGFLGSRLEQALDGIRTAATSEFTMSFGIALKKHQQEALQACLQLLSPMRTSGYFLIPTGGGKSLLREMMIFAIKMPTLVIVPTTLLMDQTIQNIKKLSPTTLVDRFDGLAKDRFRGEILVTTYQSLAVDRKREVPLIPLEQFGLVFPDEAHRGLTAERAQVIFALRQHALVFGLTATDVFDSERKTGDYSMVSEVFGPCIYESKLLTMIEERMLCPVKNVLVHAPAIYLPPKISEKDYTEGEVAKEINVDTFNAIVKDIYFNEYDPYTKERLYGQSTLIFCAGIKHADTLCKIINDANKEDRKYPLAACVHSKISYRLRNERVDLHKKGLIPVLVGDSVFAEGYDNPRDRLGFFLRPTRSSVFAKQRAGRLLRLFSGKENALIFDWKYEDLPQKLFRKFIEGRAWAGLDTAVQPQVEPRKTDGYRVDWSPSTAPIAKNISPTKIAISLSRSLLSSPMQNPFPPLPPLPWQQPVLPPSDTAFDVSAFFADVESQF